MNAYTPGTININSSSNKMKVLEILPKISMLLGMFFLPLSTSFSTIFIILTAILGLFHPQYFPNLIKAVKFPMVWILLIGVLLHVVGLLYTYAPISEALIGLKKFLKLALILFLIPIFINAKYKRSKQKPIIWQDYIYAFLLGMLLTFIAGVLKYYAHFDWGLKYSAAAVFKSHIQVNFLMAFTSFLCSTLALFARGNLRYFWLSAFVLASFFVWYLSEGRSGHLVYMVLTVLYGFQHYSYKGLCLGGLLAITIFTTAYFTADTFKTRMDDIGQDVTQYESGNMNTSIGQRIGFGKGSIKLFSQKPIIGWGTGSFASSYRDHIVAKGPLATTNPHNEYLNMMVQFGVFGLAFMVVWFSYIYFAASILPPLNNVIAQGSIASIAAGCVFNSWLLDTTEGMFLAAFMALCFSAVVNISRR